MCPRPQGINWPRPLKFLKSAAVPATCTGFRRPNPPLGCLQIHGLRLSLLVQVRGEGDLAKWCSYTGAVSTTTKLAGQERHLTGLAVADLVVVQEDLAGILWNTLPRGKQCPHRVRQQGCS